MISIDYGRSEDIEHWMRLVRKVSDSFPELETEEALTEHRQTVLDFMARREAICAKENDDIVGVLLFSKENNMLCFLAVDPIYRRQRIAEKMFRFILPQMSSGKPITVTTCREGVSTRAFYKRIGFTEGKLTSKFGSTVQEFVWKSADSSTGYVNCPCKKTKCERHGNCDACRAYHAESKRKRPCERAKISRI